MFQIAAYHPPKRSTKPGLFRDLPCASTHACYHSPMRLLFAFAGLLLKSRIEEARMRATFPEYERYRSRTPALIPFLL